MNRVHQTPAAWALLGLVLFTGNAVAQTVTSVAPSGGYVYDANNRSIRSVTGLIGAAVVGPSVADGIDWLSVAPNQKSALAGRSGSTVWIPDLSVAGTSQVLDRVPLAQQAFWAADASQAVVVTTGEQLIWLTGFNSVPVPLSSWNLELYNRGGSANSTTEAPVRVGSRRPQTVWSLLAADSAANQVLLLSQTMGYWQIWLASATAPPLNIPYSGHPVAAAFAPGAAGLFIADAANHQIVQIQNPDTSPVFTTIVSSELLVNDPAAIALSADGTRLFVADRTDSVIRVFDVSGSGSSGAASVSPMAELPATALPVSLTSFAPDRFLMNAGNDGPGSADQPFYFLDTGVPGGISFVPRGQ